MAGQTARKAETTAASARRATKAGTKRAASQSAGKKTAAKPVPAQKAAPERAPKPAAKKAPAKKTPATKAAAKQPPKKTQAKKAPARKSAAPTTPTRRTATRKAVATQVVARQLAVKAGEKPWTTAELDEVRGELAADRTRLLSELNLVEHEIQDLMRDAGDGAGNDQADVGSTTFERDHEMSLANNARHMLAQTERALSRIEDGSYGVCESCGEPIGKMRVMAFPRATLCLSCKQREERR
jgi:RNA polymerase-binding protein DksA